MIAKRGPTASPEWSQDSVLDSALCFLHTCGGLYGYMQ